MKRTDTITKLVSLLLFIALMSYLGIYLIRSMSGGISTTSAVFLSLSESGSAKGIIVRDEAFVQSSEPYLSVAVENGELVSAGDTIALAYSGEESLSRASRIHELELQQKYISSVISGKNNGASIAQKDSSIKHTIIELASAAARENTDELAMASLELSSLVMLDGTIKTTQVDLNLVTDELAQLKQTAIYDTSAIKADYPALFSTNVDGFEHISPENLSDLTPSKLTELQDSNEPIADNVLGKLSSFREWYFAANMSAADAGLLEIGKSASLDFGRYCSAPISSSVISISSERDGMCAVVFRCTSATAKMLSVRKVSAEIVFETHEGIRVPKEAVRNDEGGSFLFTLTGVQAEKKYIDLIWETDDYYLADPSTDSSALRVGNEIILSSKEIYDGQILD